MDLRKKQAMEYLKEADLTIFSAKAIFEKAQEEEKELWSHVVKMSYDAIEQAISAVIASYDEIVSKEHPAKVNLFLQLHTAENGIQKKILHWLSKRSAAQYVDIRGNKLLIPYQLFNEKDAEQAIADAEDVIEYCKAIPQQ